MWCFLKCLITLVVLYVTRGLLPLWITALQTLHFAVLLCSVSSVKYFHTADMLASHSAAQCQPASWLQAVEWISWTGSCLITLSHWATPPFKKIQSTDCSQLADQLPRVTCGVISADNVKAQTWLMDWKFQICELRWYQTRYWIGSAPSLGIRGNKSIVIKNDVNLVVTVLLSAMTSR